MNSLFFVILLFSLNTNTFCDEAEPSTRQPKLIFVSSTTSTTTLSDSTVCYVASATTAMLTCKKKKRSILNNLMGEFPETISPATSVKNFEDGVENIKVDIEENNKDGITNLISGKELTEREGRFLNYWITTTITTTYTTYTGTSSLASLICTPAGYTLDGCPGTG
jgi:hypothetical protein